MSRPVEILIVEDDDMLRDAFRLLLEDAGYAVQEAATAAAAIATAESHTPALILLDLGLPDAPGLDVVRELRTRDATRDTPIIALTGRTGESERLACMAAGCTDYFVKPLEPRILLRSLPEFLENA